MVSETVESPESEAEQPPCQKTLGHYSKGSGHWDFSAEELDSFRLKKEWQLERRRGLVEASGPLSLAGH